MRGKLKLLFHLVIPSLGIYERIESYFNQITYTCLIFIKPISEAENRDLSHSQSIENRETDETE